MTCAEQHFADLGAEMEAAPGAEVLFFHLWVIGEHQTILMDMRRTGIRCARRPPAGGAPARRSGNDVRRR
jgi:hypothetical protein